MYGGGRLLLLQNLRQGTSEKVIPAKAGIQ